MIDRLVVPTAYDPSAPNGGTVCVVETVDVVVVGRRRVTVVTGADVDR
jgi:hypothetical protein